MKKHLHDIARCAGIVAALALALAAQSLFTGQPFALPLMETWSVGARLNVGVGLLLAAMAFFAVATFGAAHPPDDTPPRAAEPFKGFRALAMYAAVGCYLLAPLIYLAVGENGAVRFFWLAGVVFLLASQFKRSAPRPRAETPSPIALYWEWGLVAVITAIAFGLRYWRLTEIPSNLDGDVASAGLQVLEVIRAPRPQWIGVGWSEYPLFAFNFMAWVMRLFGQNLYGLMMSSVISGTLTIPAVYLLGREMYGRRVGLIAAALLTISYTHIHYSRVVVVEPAPLVVTLLFFFLFRALRTQQRLWFVLAGMAMGLGLLIYYPARIGLVIVALLLAWLWLWQRTLVSGSVRHWLSLGMGACLAYGPMLGYTLNHIGDFMGRANNVTLADPGVRAHLMGKYGVETFGALLVEQVKRSFLVFHVFGDKSTLFGFQGPMVDVLTAALLVLGVGWCLARLRQPKPFVLLAWLVTVLVLGGVVTNDPPFWPHLIVVLPAVAVLGALAADRVWEGLACLLGRVRPLDRAGQWGLGALLVAALICTGIHNWQVYYQHVRDNARMPVRIARYVNTLPADVRVRLVTTSISWRDREFQFLAPGTMAQDMSPDQLQAEPQPCRDAPIVFILTPDHMDLEHVLEDRCPGGTSRLHVEPSRRLSFFSYQVGPQAVQYGISPSDLAFSVSGIDSLAWRLFAGWALVLVGTVGAYYWFVVRRLLKKRALKPTAESVALRNVRAGWLKLKSYFEAVLDRLQSQLAALSQQASHVPYGHALLQRAREWSPPSVSPDRVRKAMLVWGVPLCALALAYVAQSIWDVGSQDKLGVGWRALEAWSESSRLWLGACVYLAAMVVWAVRTPDLGAAQVTPTASSQTPPPAQNRAVARIRAWAWLWVLLPGLVCYALSVVRFGLWGEDTLVRQLWAGGLVLFAASALLGLWARQPGSVEAPSPHWGWKQIAILSLILAVAFGLRFYRLDVLPSDFHGDMASHGLMARSLLLGEERNLFHDGWANLPFMTFAPAAISLRVFGNNLSGLQMTSVLGGMMSLLGFYFLVWRLFDRHRLAALATALAAINVVHIHFSRIAEYIDPWPFAVWALFLVVDGLRARRLSSLALAGLFMGFGVQMYYSGRVVVFILAAFLMYALLFQRQWVTRNLSGLVLMVLGGLVALGPDLIYFARNWGAFMERSREVWLYGPDVMAHLQNKYQIPSVVGVTLRQIELSVLMFHHSIDSSTQFGYAHPMFNSWVSPLIVLGLGYSLRRWRTPGTVLMLAWLFLVMVVGSALTVDAPFWPRLVSIVLPAALLAALALEQVLSLADKLAGRRGVWIVGILVALLLVQAGVQMWTVYYKTVQDNARPPARVGRFLASLPPQVAACDFLDPIELQVREVQFLAWPRELVDLASDAPDDALATCPGPPMVWILTPNHRDRLGALQMRWPGGVVEEHYEPNDTHVFTSYLVWGEHAAIGPSSITGAWTFDFRPLIGLLGFVTLIWLTTHWLTRRQNSATHTLPSILVVEYSQSLSASTASAESSIWRRVWRYATGIGNLFKPSQRWLSLMPDAELRESVKQWFAQRSEWPRIVSALGAAWSSFVILGVPIIAVCLAYLAQGVFDAHWEDGIRLPVDWFSSASEGNLLLVGAFIYVMAALLWVQATRPRSPGEIELAEKSELPKPCSFRFSTRPQALVFGLALLFSASAMLLFAITGETALVRWLWLGGLLAFVGSLWSWHRTCRVSPQAEFSTRFSWINLAILLVILAVGLGLRLYRLETLPENMHFDMGAFGLQVRDYLLGNEHNIFGKSSYASTFGLPLMMFLPYAASMRLLGDNIFGLQFVAVVVGTFSLLGGYLLVWRSFDQHRLAALTTAIVAINIGHIHLSRTVLYIEPAFFIGWSLFLLVDGLRARRAFSLALAGISMGFAVQTYFGSRVIPVIAAVFLVYVCLFKRRWVTENWGGLFLLALGALLALGPNLIYFARNWELVISRAWNINILNPQVLQHVRESANPLPSDFDVIMEQIKRSVLMFNYYTDASVQYGIPLRLFGSALSPLLVLGLGVGLRRWREPCMALSLLSFGLILVLGSIMSSGAPSWTRIVAIVPFAALFIALALDQSWELLEKAKARVLAPVLTLGVVALLIFAGWTAWNSYYKWGATNAEPITRAGRYLGTLPLRVAACRFQHSYFALHDLELQFLAGPRQLVDMPADASDADIDTCPGLSLVWILSPDQLDRLDILRAHWPNGIVEGHYGTNGDLSFSSYLVAP